MRHRVAQRYTAPRPAAASGPRFAPSADGARLDYTMTVTDATTFTRPVEMSTFWIWRPEIRVEPYACRRVAP
jgi:hypothetical protein